MEGTYTFASPLCASPSTFKKEIGNGRSELAKESIAIHPRNTRFSSEKYGIHPILSQTTI
jgi:hypothetical protein